MDASEWKGATEQALGEVSGGKATPPTRVRIMYDRKNLYVAWACEEPQIATLKTDRTGRDGPVWALDCVELFLDTENSLERYQHFIATPVAGSFYDARKGFIPDRLHPAFAREDPEWNPDWRYAATIDADKKVWGVEMAIPFTILGAGPPERGAVWCANFGRERYAGGSRELFLWSPNDKGGFCDPMSFGEIHFED